jgi:hypothetical protein
VQAIAFKVYRHVPVAPSLHEIVEKAWDLLPRPESVPAHAPPDASTLNYFVPKPDFLVRRRQIFTNVAHALRAPDANTKVVSKRYAPSLITVPSPVRADLAERVELLAAAISDEGQANVAAS